MKRKLLLVLPIAMTLCSCDFNFLVKKQSTDVNHVPGNVTIIPDDEPDEMKQHATSLSQNPNAPFYLKIDEEKLIDVSLSPAPTDASEKTFKWSLKGDNQVITYQVIEDATNKCRITGKKAGEVELTATNEYNETLNKTFYIKVIEFDPETDYLWQYVSDDKAQFGYTSENKAGVASGTANLNGMKWKFERSNVSSLNLTQPGYLGFGKGNEPETHLHFELENARTVNSISIEATSANSLAKMTVKVGETTYVNNVTVNKLADSKGPIVNGSITPTIGKIEIDVDTPEFDSSRIEDPTYKKPGAFYIKSILIDFEEKLPDKIMTLVSDLSEIVEDEKYLIVGYSAEGYGALDGTLSTSVKDKPYFLEDFSLDASVTVPANFDKYGFTASFDNNSKLNFKSDSNIQIGLSKGGGISLTASPALLGWDYEMDANNHLNMSMLDEEDTPKTKYFGANETTGKFSSYASAKNNIYLYKF